jgi:DNA-binding transcriptional MerR regulator
MAESHDPAYLSIGEVLGLLLEEFPDITISKIRFLESQGLISPERTPSGYRKFYPADVDRIRVILTEQQRNYLPLRVIRERLDTGEIDPTGEHLWGDADHAGDDATPADVPPASIAIHPASRGMSATPDVDSHVDSDEHHRPRLLPNTTVDRSEFCRIVGLTDDELDRLEEYAIIHRTAEGRADGYDRDAVSVATAAVKFLRLGIDARNLRQFRNAAEREASMFEQVVQPKFRQRNPAARAEALDGLRRMGQANDELRAAVFQQVLRRHFNE